MDALEELADSAELIAAQRAGDLDDVEDELFRFGRIAAGSSELRAALADRIAGARQDRAAGHAARRPGHPVTERLVVRLVTAPRGRSLEGGIESLSKLAAARRGRMVAEVVSAVPLSDRQKRAAR